MSIGFPDGQRITQWLGAPIDEQTAFAIGAGARVVGPFNLASWASVIVACKPTGGALDVTIKQQISGGPVGLQLSETFHVAAGATLFEAVVLFGDAVTVTFQGAAGGETLDYAIYPSNTTTNANVITQATINLQRNGALVAAEPTLDFEDGGGITWALTDDAPNTRLKVAATVLALPAAARVRQAAAQAIASGGGAVCTFAGVAAADYDSAAFWNAANPSRLRAPVAGWYRVTASVGLVATGAGTNMQGVAFKINGGAGFVPTNGAQGYSYDSQGGQNANLATMIVQLAAGDYIEMLPYQTTGGAVNTVPADTWFAIERVA